MPLSPVIGINNYLKNYNNGKILLLNIVIVRTKANGPLALYSPYNFPFTGWTG